MCAGCAWVLNCLEVLILRIRRSELVLHELNGWTCRVWIEDMNPTTSSCHRVCVVGSSSLSLAGCGQKCCGDVGVLCECKQMWQLFCVIGHLGCLGLGQIPSWPVDPLIDLTSSAAQQLHQAATVPEDSWHQPAEWGGLSFLSSFQLVSRATFARPEGQNTSKYIKIHQDTSTKTLRNSPRPGKEVFLQRSLVS